MSSKIAVAIVHGVGITQRDFADGMIAELRARFAQATGADASTALVCEPVYWGPILQGPEDELWSRLRQGGDLDFVSLRRFMVSFAADALAYQPARGEADKYEEIHAEFARVMQRLAANAGAGAPLVVISHSLGTIISSNYFYDLTRPRRLIAKAVRAQMGRPTTPLERGETLAYFVTMGSPIALWSLRYDDFGVPVAIPAPALGRHYPKLVPLAAWDNFYDPDDVIGYPLKTLNPAYGRAVANDYAVNAGGLLTSWNPASHISYWTDNDVTKPVAGKLAALWEAMGG
ncbi:MAG: chemotaxis protein [Opitutae bacterium]|nr:chemotaxis protein [Opitutae bacterium]